MMLGCSATGARLRRHDAPTWTYWAGRGDAFEIYFEGDQVSRV